MDVYVDLDSTFYKVDTLTERLVQRFFHNPIHVFIFFVKFFTQGRLSAKVFLDNFYMVDYLFPVNDDVLSWLIKRKKHGDNIYLISASTSSVVEKCFVRYSYVFDGWFSSKNAVNLKGCEKLSLIVEKSGDNFAYIGDSKADVPIWYASSEAYIVGNKCYALFGHASLRESVTRIDNPTNFVKKLTSFVRLIRFDQWLKNLIIFLPLIIGGSWTNASSWLQLLTVFILFCFVASIGYILNDILDVYSDRKHKTKKSRPIASGLITHPVAITSLCFLCLCSFFLSSLVSSTASYMILLYLACSLSYSLFLKKILILDVFVLAGFYLSRLYTGSFEIDLWPSIWFSCFFFLVFFSLALVKRYSDLVLHSIDNDNDRLYKTDDMPVLLVIGVSTSITSCLILLLYSVGYSPVGQYVHKDALFILAMFLFMFFCYIWMSASRGNVLGDPLTFVTRDVFSLTLVFICVLLYIYSVGVFDV